MVHSFTNQELSQLLKNVSAAYQIKGGNQFQIRAYELASEAIDSAASDLKDLWEAGELGSIPGLGKGLQEYLDELFKTGQVKHFESIFKDIPKGTFALLVIPGVGPKTALKLASSGVKGLSDLEKKLKSGELFKKGFSEKTAANILQGLASYQKKSDRTLLPVAYEVAEGVLKHLKSSSAVLEADPLGSLRRMVSTVGDIDIAASSNKPEEVIKHFLKTPGVAYEVESGERTATVELHNGLRVDLMVQPSAHYGSLLQHFTGSKQHNIHLRKIALDQGYSLSEYGVKETKSGKVIEIEAEEELYKLLGMETPPPEIREDLGEIESALRRDLPDLIELKDIKGDLHAHTSWSDGRNTVSEMAEAAKSIGYEYLALTDHSYPSLDFKGRIKEIEQYNSNNNNYRVIYGLEVNINSDGTMQVPDEILKMHQWNYGSIHTSFRQSKEEMTQRLLKAIEHPYIDVIAHPTGRLLLQREGIEADWEKIFQAIVSNGKYLEIDSLPDRLDLPDNLVKEALKFGVKFVIGSDSHHTSHFPLIRYGVSVGQRGWLEKKVVINSLKWGDFERILKSRR